MSILSTFRVTENEDLAWNESIKSKSGSIDADNLTDPPLATPVSTTNLAELHILSLAQAEYLEETELLECQTK